MKKISLLLLPILLLGCASTPHHNFHHPTRAQMMAEMILPAPRISNIAEITEDTDMSQVGWGTGTSLVSRPAEEGYETFVVTNAHVVAPMIKKDLLEKIQKARSGDMPTKFSIDLDETFNPIYVTYYKYDGWTSKEEQAVARVLTYDEIRDVALLRFESDHAFPVVNISRDPSYEVFQEVWSIGGALGNNPFPTTGIISLIAEKNIAPEDKEEFIMRKILLTAPVAGGASGGPTFQYSRGCGCFEWVAINQQIAVNPVQVRSMNPRVRLPPMAAMTQIYHMHWAIPVKEIQRALVDTDFEDLLDK